MLLVCLCITVEVAIILGFHLWWNINSILINITSSGLFFIKFISDSLEAAESLDWFLVNVLVLELWLQHNIKESLFSHFLLVHLHFLLLFLDTDMDTMYENIFVNDIW